MNELFESNGGIYPVIDEETNNFIYNIADDFTVDIVSSKGVQLLRLRSISQQTTYTEFGTGPVGKSYSKSTDLSYAYDVDSPHKKTPKSGGARFWYHKGLDDEKAKITNGQAGIYFAYDAFWELAYTGLYKKIFNQAYETVSKKGE